jgi:succinylarginine dihydrolase
MEETMSKEQEFLKDVKAYGKQYGKNGDTIPNDLIVDLVESYIFNKQNVVETEDLMLLTVKATRAFVAAWTKARTKALR